MKKTIAGALVALFASTGVAHAQDGFQGWWWDPSKDGMGLNIAQQGDMVALTWYHFDTDGTPTYNMLAGKVINGILAGDLQTASGPPPGDGYSPWAVKRSVAGKGSIIFTTAETALFEYALNGGQGGSLSLTRFPMPRAGESMWAYTIAGRNCGSETGGYAWLWQDSTGSSLATMDYRGYPSCLYTSVVPGTPSGYQCVTDRFSRRESGAVTVNGMLMDDNAFVFDYSASPSLSLLPSCPATANQRITGSRFLNDTTSLSGWWWNPALDGMGINIEQENGTIALSWYYFDKDNSSTYALLAGPGEFEFEMPVKPPKPAEGATEEESAYPPAVLEIPLLQGDLQRATGPAPGPGYDPAGVKPAPSPGKAELVARYNFESGGSELLFKYSLAGCTPLPNTDYCASLVLQPFTMQGIPQPMNGVWDYTARHDIPAKSSGTAGLVGGNGRYQMTTRTSNWICTYNLLLGQTGSIFTGNGTVECTGAEDKKLNGYVVVDRLQTTGKTLIFDYHNAYWAEDEDSAGPAGTEQGNILGTLVPDPDPTANVKK